MSFTFTPEVQARPDTSKPGIFLGGSIEMGKAEDWQAEMIKEFDVNTINVFNPRRANWDSTWEQSIHNRNFEKQVTWELDMIQASDCVIMMFKPDTQSPISLLEFGLIAGANGEGALNKMIVSCPKGFWRKGNVDVVAKRFHIPVIDDPKEFVDEARAMMMRNWERRTTIKNQGWDYRQGGGLPG